jgi:hypothetical protein
MVELLISSVILSLGFVAMGQLYVASMWTYEKSHDLSVATQRAQFELEKAAHLKYEGLTVADLSSAYPSPQYTVSQNRTISFNVPDLPSGEGTITMSKDPYNAGGAADQNLLGVLVTINWRGSGFPRGGIRVNTLISHGK